MYSMPNFAVYILHTGEKILGDGANVPFPCVIADEDVFLYKDYKYTFHKSINGWHVEAYLKTQQYYCEILEEIAGRPVLSMHETFKDCTALIESPAIPSTVNDMRKTFSGCFALKKGAVGKNVVDMSNCFEKCSMMEIAPQIPVGLRSMNFAFAYCNNLYEVPDLSENREIIFMDNAFEGCSQITKGPNIYKCMYLKSMKETFKDCINMASIPALPKNIENACGTFMNCSALKEKPNVPIAAQVDENTFAGCNF